MRARAPEADVALRPVRTGAGPADRITGWVAVGVVLVLWEVLCRALAVSSLYLPRPTQIAVALYDLFVHKEALVDLAVTLYRIFGGFAIGLAFGVALGLAMAVSRRFESVADVFIAALYPLPKITLIPLLIIWLGTGGPFMLTISALGALFPVIINTLLGVRQVDQGLVMTARDLGASERQIIRHVLLPAAVPSVFAGARLGLGVSIILVVAAEMVVGKLGLGARLYLAGQVLETETVFAVLVVLAALGIIVTKALDALDALSGKWRS
jgi:ABC-type nitrate/sulfonate/bicarbonate transport system permease component